DGAGGRPPPRRLRTRQATSKRILCRSPRQAIAKAARQYEPLPKRDIHTTTRLHWSVGATRTQPLDPALATAARVVAPRRERQTTFWGLTFKSAPGAKRSL